jgi:MarR family transcriptional regulator, organic hydroperoxide resistance regulator
MKWRATVDVAVAPPGLTHAQYTVLAALRGVTRSGVSPSQRQLPTTPASIPSMSRSWYAPWSETNMSSDVHDSRAVRLSTTEKGLERDRPGDRGRQRPPGAADGAARGTSSTRLRTLMSDLEVLIAAPQPNQAPPTTKEPQP